jgi:hypothetical protein
MKRIIASVVFSWTILVSAHAFACEETSSNEAIGTGNTAKLLAGTKVITLTELVN